MSAAFGWLAVRDALIAARTGQGASQAKIAGSLGVTPQAVSLWETGGTFPAADKLFAWAKLLGVRIVIVPQEAPSIPTCAHQAVQEAA